MATGGSSKINKAVPPDLFDSSSNDSMEFYEKTLEEELQDSKIRIVPSIGYQAGLNKQDFDITLDENLQSWFETIHETFRVYKKNPILTNMIQRFYDVSLNPYLNALKFFANCPDHNSPKQNSFAYTVLEELSKFKKKNPQSNIHIDDNLKMVSFNFAKNSGQLSALKIIVFIFELKESNHLFKDEIKNLLQKRQYKEAGQFACDLELFDEFEVDDFIIPLILEDKLGIVEDYLDKAARLRQPTVEFLDSLLDKSSTVPQLCDPWIQKYGLKNVKYDKLSKKPIGKLIARLCKKYRIDDENTPNYARHKRHGALHFLLRKNYSEKTLSKHSWEEMVKDTIPADDIDLQIDLIDSCFDQWSDMEESVKWIKYFNIPMDKVHPGIVNSLSNKDTNQNVEENWDDMTTKDTEKIHQLKLPFGQLQMIDTVGKFHHMIDVVSKLKLIAFDTEWKPAILKSNEISLIQIATRDHVYLIDVMTLCEQQIADEDWGRLGRDIFNNNDIIKLGFAQSTDFSMFDKFLPAIGVQYETMDSQLDIQELWRKVEKIKGFRFPYNDDCTSQNQSLSNLVKLCLGAKLDKSNQFSNWSNRPLRHEQIVYAALDAYCLFEIYDIIEQIVVDIKHDFNSLINEILLENRRHFVALSRKKDNTKKNRKHPANTKYSKNHHPIHK